MPKCQNCGRHRGEQYARVFGDEENQLQACSSCVENGAMAAGAGAGIEPVGGLRPSD